MAVKDSGAYDIMQSWETSQVQDTWPNLAKVWQMSDFVAVKNY